MKDQIDNRDRRQTDRERATACFYCGYTDVG